MSAHPASLSNGVTSLLSRMPALPQLAVYVSLFLHASSPPCVAQKADKWFEARTPHFVIVGDASEKRTKEIGEEFEQVRAVFYMSMPKLQAEPSKPVIIFAVKNEESLRALIPWYWEEKNRMRPAGVFRSGPHNHYILLRTDAPEADRNGIVYHEYFHPLECNNLCWYASLHGFADLVLPVCEQAVRLEPDHGGYRDSRGLGRALTGDYSGAIEDFRYYLKWGEKEQRPESLQRREQWVKELESGRNPFDDETLQDLLRPVDNQGTINEEEGSSENSLRLGEIMEGRVLQCELGFSRLGCPRRGRVATGVTTRAGATPGRV